MCLKYDHAKTLAIANGKPPFQTTLAGDFSVFKVYRTEDKKLFSPFRHDKQHGVITSAGEYKVENAGTKYISYSNSIPEILTAEDNWFDRDIIGFHCFLESNDADLMLYIMRGGAAKYKHTALFTILRFTANIKDVVAYGQSDNIVNKTSWLPNSVVVSRMNIEPMHFEKAIEFRNG